MMQCDVCKDTNGPFYIDQYKTKLLLLCKDCDKRLKKEMKKNDTTRLFNKRHAH